ncbi:nucleotidyltransferase family protein [Roseomonas sp. SSH11]|uniref:glucose-1-phosphate thymidylyltransferase n=1 Tax=Pararoseomonas baculiformis TaxID=2820812 RepID=A0ABS4A9E0_9PROT|nr:sugar phosphate nucleotidyltransferase [Pararoseomonas baculiformis]MBP0443613.1 nucleotidyltransferase family protein [Pararoseomonas baculiformis]
MSRVWGVVPAAGQGTRIQPLAFSKELLPVGSRVDESGVERPRAVSEHLVERMVLGGADRILFVISPLKSDILRYYGASYGSAEIAYAVQERAAGLCDAIFRAVPFIAPEDQVLVGLPDTVWFPADALRHLPDDRLSFLLFPVERPELFDAVDTDAEGRVREILVKRPGAATNWIWGAFKMPGATLHALHALWEAREREDEYIGTLVNAWIARGNDAWGLRAGSSYVDTGTLNGYRDASRLLDGPGDLLGLPDGRRGTAGEQA